MTTSIVAVTTDVVRGGRSATPSTRLQVDPLQAYGIGTYARMIERVA
jgi:hypothetical protein